MKSLKYPFLLLATIATLMAHGQYVQPMNYDDYSISGRLNIGGGKTRLTAASAYLELGDPLYSRKGLLFPRGKKDSIPSPARGLVIFDLPTSKLQVYNGTAWEELGTGAMGSVAGGGTGGRLALFNSSSSLVNSQLYDDGSNVGIGASPHAVYKLYVNGHGYFNGNIAAYAGVHSGADYKVMVDASGIFRYVPDVANNNWGGMTGPINSQTDLIDKFNLYQPKLISGAGYEYRKGNDSLGNLQTDVRSAGDGYFRKTTDQQPASSISDFVASVKGVFSAGDNITISPLGVIAATGGGSGGSLTMPQLFLPVRRSAGTGPVENTRLDPATFAIHGDTVTALGSTNKDTVATLVGITALDNLAALRSSTVYQNGSRMAITRGRAASNDGGGAEWYWDAASTATDNGMDIISPSGYSGSGRWKLLIKNQTVDLRQLGAVADNSTNCKPYLLRALAMGYPNIYVPSNLDNDNAHTGPYYHFSDSVTITRKVHIYGDGRDKTVISFPNSVGLYYAFASSGSRLNELKIKGSSGGYGTSAYRGTRYGLFDEGIIYVDGCEFESFPGDGMYIYASSGTNNASHSIISNNWFRFNGRNGVTVKGGDANTIKFDNNYYVLNKQWGLADSSFLGNTYLNNHFASNAIIDAGGFSVVVRADSLFYAKFNNGPANGGVVIPGVTSGWQNYWTYIQRAGGYPTTYTTSANYFVGGSFTAVDANQSGTLVSNYEERDGPGLQNANNLILGGVQGINGAEVGAIGMRLGRITAHDLQTFDVPSQSAATINTTPGNISNLFMGFRDEQYGEYIGLSHVKADRRISIAAGQPDTWAGHIFTSASSSTSIGRAIPSTGAVALNGLWLPVPAGGWRMLGFASAAPTTGSYAAGDCFIDNTSGGNLAYVCTASGTPGTWIAKVAGTGGASYSAGYGLKLTTTTFEADSFSTATRARLQKVADSLGAVIAAISGGSPSWTGVSGKPNGGNFIYNTTAPQAATLNIDGKATVKEMEATTTDYTGVTNPGSDANKKILNARGLGVTEDNVNLSSAYQPTVGIGIAVGRSAPALSIKNTGGYALLVESGNVGIGTSTPGQLLTVAGTIESSSGGFKFPDGSTQTTAANSGFQTATLTTTTATQQTPWTYTPTAAGHYRVEVIGNSHRTDAAGAYGAKKSRKFYYNGTTLIQNAAVTDIEADEYFTGLGGATFTIEASSGAIVVHFTGESGATIQSTFTIILTKSN